MSNLNWSHNTSYVPKTKTDANRDSKVLNPNNIGLGSGSTKLSTAACKRCRSKKIKCDQKFPSCGRCAKLGEPCVSVDPGTGMEVPRSYVFYLEDRLSALLHKLEDLGINPNEVKGNIPTNSYDKPCDSQIYGGNVTDVRELHRDQLLAEFLINHGSLMQEKRRLPEINRNSAGSNFATPRVPDNIMTPAKDIKSATPIGTSPQINITEFNESNKRMNGFASMQSESNDTFLGDSSGVSFARLVFTAASFEPNSLTFDIDEDLKSREVKHKQYEEAERSEGFDPLELPSREEAIKLIQRFFFDTNSQLPVFHRETFLKKYFEPIYGSWPNDVKLTSDGNSSVNTEFKLRSNTNNEATGMPTNWYSTWQHLKSVNLINDLSLPKALHSPYFMLNMIFAIGSATKVLTSDIHEVVTYKRRAFNYTNSLFMSSDRLEVLAGTLLMTIYSIMRPNVPGVWYVMGSVLRLTVDLGLHMEKLNVNYDAYTKEIRRRLFWCVYSLDRQICSYFGRPFGIPEESITTRYPSLLDDASINMEDENVTDYSDVLPKNVTYKQISMAIFEVRKIQANIVKILYAPHSEIPRDFPNLETWRSSTLKDLESWYHKTVPRARDNGYQYCNSLFDLNFHYTQSILYGLSPKCPKMDTNALRIVLQNTKGTIDVFYDLLERKSIGYTWVAVHNLFMTGMTYLYVIYYSSKCLGEDITAVKPYINKVLDTLKSLIGTCDTAINCFKSYKLLSEVVLKLTYDSERQVKFKNFQGANSKNIGQVSHDNGFDTLRSHSLKQQAKESLDGASTVKQENNIGTLFTMHKERNQNDVAFDEFFSQLEKRTSISEGMTKQILGELRFSDEQHAGRSSNRSHTNEDLKHISATTVDGHDISDILFQVTSESVWDEFFVKNNHDGDGNSNKFSNYNNLMDSFFQF